MWWRRKTQGTMVSVRVAAQGKLKARRGLSVGAAQRKVM